MTWRLGFVTLLLLAAGTLSAQGMSHEYVEARAAEKFARPHGLTVDLNLFAHVPFFEQQARVRAQGLPGDRISFADDVGGLPLGIFMDAEIRARFTWHDSVEFGYGFHVLRSSKGALEESRRFNGVLYPEGTDLDYGADFHDLRIHYRRDIFRAGLAKNFTAYGLVGLEWAGLATSVASENFPVQDNRKQERFRELLPWWNAGVGAEIEIGQRIRIYADARGTYAVGMPTLQKRDDSTMKQSVVSLGARAAFEYRFNEWFTLIARVKARYLRVRVYGGDTQADFLWYSLGPQVGFGLLF